MKLIHVLLFCLITLSTFAQTKKILHIQRTDTPPVIDGIIDDAVWTNVEEAKDFIQFRPEMGVLEKPHQKTIVKMTYDDQAIYLLAYLHDNPDDIQIQNTRRDNFGESDFFGVVFDTNNDSQNAIEFFVQSSGTQADAFFSVTSGEDFSWNSVWDSAVKIVDDGWIIEIKIPYSALRFSKKNLTTWGIQFHRRYRKDNSQYSWNPIDRTVGNITQYNGELIGLKDISPPTRLSFYPFASAQIKTYDGNTQDDYSIGMDVKYGITENFTLDATLVPDFSQVGFDNVELNLSPFEQRFSEQRQFFTEGIDLFTKGNLFYSRRIGSAPSTYPETTPDEQILDYPNKVTMLNAVKVSGRTKKGLGIGFFNAITEKTEVTIKNLTTNQTRKEVVEPLANYNIFVLDQQFGKNSSVSLINTNVLRDGHFRDANVTAALFNLTNKENKYNLSGSGKMSILNLQTGSQTGFSADIRAGKISGNYQFSLGYSMMDDDYDINDMGILFRNNYSNLNANASYRIFEPSKKLNSFSLYSWASIQWLFTPGSYTGNNFGLGWYAQTKKLLSFGGNFNGNAGKQYDYFEPRTPGRYFLTKNEYYINSWMETNTNKKFSLSIYGGAGTMFDKTTDFFTFWAGISPNIRFNEKFILNYSFDYDTDFDQLGYVTNSDQDIIFGNRFRQVIENSISGSYNMNSFHSLTLTFRNYWAMVEYDHNFYVLQENGTLTDNGTYTFDNLNTNPDVNFSTWNLDLKYSWEFAKGSQVTVLYRNSLFNTTTASQDGYLTSLGDLFKQPIEHVFSVRLLYYIDYNNIKHLLRKKR